MATSRPRRVNPVYAVASASANRGYGHVNIHVFALKGFSNATLKISCQSGGESKGTYAWNHGLSSEHSVVRTEALKQGYWLMRRIDRELEKMRDEQGLPSGFADYALRVLRAAGIRKTHFLPGLNPGYRDPATLPSLDPVRQGELVLENLKAMEAKIVSETESRA